jgi:tetratricopeptide (TPR) repeat protein
MIRKRITWASLGLLLALSASAAVAAMPDIGNDDEGNSLQESLYERGSDALDEGHWERALEAFAEAARMSGDRTEGSLYWKAYAETKLGRRNEAVATIAELKRRFPKSRWTNDAAALEVEAAGRNARPESESDDELKLIAINSLVNSDPERAHPLLQKILQGPQTPKMKERALFVLAQSGSAQARQMVADIARGKSNPGLQEKAIKYLGLFGGKESRQILSEIYASNPSVEARERILKSFMTAGDREHVLAAARTEKDARLRAAAARLLGVMGARQELWDLYRTEPDREVKDAIVQGMFVAGDAEHISELARNEKDPELRHRAISKLGLLGRTRTGEMLLSIYRGDKDPEARRAALQGLFVQNNAHALVELARVEKDREWKQEIVQKLSVMHDKEATDYLIEILNK